MKLTVCITKDRSPLTSTLLNTFESRRWTLRPRLVIPVEELMVRDRSATVGADGRLVDKAVLVTTDSLVFPLPMPPAASKIGPTVADHDAGDGRRVGAKQTSLLTFICSLTLPSTLGVTVLRQRSRG